MWTEPDRIAALAWQAEQALRCAGCGHPLDETMSPEAEGAWRARALRCHACAARARALDNHEGSTEGLYWTVERS